MHLCASALNFLRQGRGREVSMGQRREGERGAGSIKGASSVFGGGDGAKG